MQKAPPRLAPPGAGVPFPQKIMMRFVVKPFVAEKSPWPQSRQSFEKVTEKILREIEGLNAAQLNEKTLVPPQVGLEDSSRFWSIAMALEHLVIVGRGIAQVLQSLEQGLAPNAKADTGKMKPFGQMTAAESIEDFKKFAFEEYPRIKTPETNLKFSHPWFGPMTARAWYSLLGQHHVLHLKQIREIKKGLKSA